MVKWYKADKGFGFITRDNGLDIFVHHKDIRGEDRPVLSPGQRVEFSPINRGKGLMATDVTPL